MVLIVILIYLIAEAISLSDNIILLTKRPGRIKAIYKLNFDETILPSTRKKDEIFDTLYDDIWRNIDHD